MNGIAHRYLSWGNLCRIGTLSFPALVSWVGSIPLTWTAFRTSWRSCWRTPGSPTCAPRSPTSGRSASSAESTAECLDSWAAELGRGNAVAVTADAFFLPWLPYCGNEHMEHGFVVEGVEGGREPVLHVVDPYENRTRRGHARPTTTKVVLGDLGHALDRGAWAVLEPCGRRNRWTPNAKSGRTAKPGHARRHQLISAFSAQEARGSLFFAVHRGVIP
jgi:hypothetical protein